MAEKEKNIREIVHKLNNCLLIFTGRLELLKMEGQENLSENQKESLRSIQTAVQNLKDIRDDLDKLTETKED